MQSKSQAKRIASQKRKPGRPKGSEVTDVPFQLLKGVQVPQRQCRPRSPFTQAMASLSKKECLEIPTEYRRRAGAVASYLQRMDQKRYTIRSTGESLRIWRVQ